MVKQAGGDRVLVVRQARVETQVLVVKQAKAETQALVVKQARAETQVLVKRARWRPRFWRRSRDGGDGAALGRKLFPWRAQCTRECECRGYGKVRFSSLVCNRWSR